MTGAERQARYYRSSRAVVHLARSVLVTDKPLCGIKVHPRVTGFYDQVTCSRCLAALRKKISKAEKKNASK
jgi:hypothetical protein